MQNQRFTSILVFNYDILRKKKSLKKPFLLFEV